MYRTMGSDRMKRRPVRTVVASLAIAASLGAMTSCSDSAGPEAGEVTTEDLQEIENDASAELTDEEKSALVGQDVTVSAEISELITQRGVGSAFRVAGDTGPSMAVLATTPPDGLQRNDVVRVSGTVTTVRRDSFENDFGVAADDLFDEPDTFFQESEGEVAIAATEIEVLQDQSDE